MKERLITTLVIDTDCNNFEVYNFVWNNTIYKHTQIGESRNLIHKKSKGYKLCPIASFLDILSVDSKHKISASFEEYFVFPRIYIKSNDKYSSEEEICKSDVFLKDIYEKRKIIIEGNDNTGKTTLIKYLYLQLINKKIPLLFSADDIRQRALKRIIAARMFAG